MSTITAKDGAQIYYKDWGRGQPVVLSHGWPLSADAWEDQMLFLATRGYRCVAHDRRGHGRSSQPGSVIGASAMRTAHMVKGATLKVVPGAPHGLCSTLKDQVNAELLAFFKT